MHLAFQLIYYLLKHHQKRSQWKDGKCRYVKLHKNCTENQWKQVVNMQGGGQEGTTPKHGGGFVMVYGDIQPVVLVILSTSD